MIFPRIAPTRALKTGCVEEIQTDCREYDPGFIARRDTPVTLQAGLRACEWMKIYPDESPSHALVLAQWQMTQRYSLTVAGAAPELPCPVRLGAPASRFTLNTVVFRAPVAKS